MIKSGRGRRPLAITLGVLAVAVLTGGCTAAPVRTGHPRLTSHSLSAGLSGVGVLPPPASAWPEAGHDARFSSATSVTGPQTGRVQWSVSLGGDATPGPVIGVDGSILAATNAGVLFALDPATGARRWSFDAHGSYGIDLSTSPGVVSSGIILWPGPHDTLYALDQSGNVLWRRAFAGQVLSPAVAGHQRVYVADLTGQLVALDVSGRVPREIWHLNVGGPDYASPSVGPDGTIFTAAKNDLVAVRDLGSTGKVRWRLRTSKLVEVSNSVAPNGDVVLGTNHDREYGVTPTGRVDWALDIGDFTYSSSVTRPDGTAYFGDNTGRVRTVDTRTGRIAHTITPLGGGVEKVWTMVIADAAGDFYWATTQGHVYGYDRRGQPLFHLNVGSGVNSYPALGADGTLYLGTTAGRLIAIGPKH